MYYGPTGIAGEDGFMLSNGLVLNSSIGVIGGAEKPGQQVTNSIFNFTGTVTDNGAGSNVWYQVNHGAWNKAGGWALWSARVTLQPGENSLNAYAVDAAGNISTTNQRSLTLTVPTP